MYNKLKLNINMNTNTKLNTKHRLLQLLATTTHPPGIGHCRIGIMATYDVRRAAKNGWPMAI